MSVAAVVAVVVIVEAVEAVAAVRMSIIAIKLCYFKLVGYLKRNHKMAYFSCLS
jgi:hypothetical protein